VTKSFQGITSGRTTDYPTKHHKAECIAVHIYNWGVNAVAFLESCVCSLSPES
jgi:hypothetical protein